jgi:Fe2+ transport system protein FeoA
MESTVTFPVSEGSEPSLPTRLSELPVGAHAVVVQVQATGPIRRRLLEMGFVRGEVLKVEKLAPLGDPMELVIKGYHLSLRRNESACILVRQEG